MCALRETCDRLGITWLEREVLQSGSVRFVGTTLWADFDALVTDADRLDGSNARVLKKREKAFRAANYYLRKMGTTRARRAAARRRLARAGARVRAMAAPGARRSFRRHDRRRHALRAQPAQRRSALRAHARHRGLLQFAGRTAAAGAVLAARPPALPAGLRGRRLPRHGQHPGLCRARRTGGFSRAARDRSWGVACVLVRFRTGSKTCAYIFHEFFTSRTWCAHGAP